MDILIIIGSVLAITAIIGSIVPALPGPILGYGALVLLYVSRGADGITPVSLGIFGAFLILVTIIGYVAPIWGARFSGASKRGVWGAVLGAILGLIFFLPLGLFLGAFLGAIIGELSTGKDGSAALKAGIGTLLGSVMVIFLQTLFALVMAGYYFYSLIRN
ncbi:MAG: DUF456 domain-containing protein [Candidatus Moraniibacteriota bacterium]|nr:MAG: DUF456 domain-containing protein [Candidatus Moranbacteria bacterium]